MPPTTTARQDPAGIRLTDGYRSLIAFASDPDVSLWEIDVTPPGADGGPPVDTTTMHNDTVITKDAQALIDFTDGQMTVAYDPRVLNQIINLLNKPTSITVHYPDGSTDDYYGYLRTFARSNMVRGTMPTATCAITITNAHPTTGAETLPNYISGAGTDI